MDKYQQLAELLNNPVKADAILSESIEETLANLKANGLDFSIEELEALAAKVAAQQEPGELSEDVLDDVAGGFVSSGSGARTSSIWSLILKYVKIH